MPSISASTIINRGISRGISQIVIDSASSYVVKNDRESLQDVAAPVQPVVKIGVQNTSDTNVDSVATAIISSPDREAFKKGFRDCLLADSSDYGMKSMAEIFVESWMSKGAFQVQLWLSEVYLENQNDPNTLLALLKVVMHVDPAVFTPINRMIALASLSHASLEVRECAVRCYEYWEIPAYYVDLTARLLEPAWLEEYKNSFLS